MHTSDYPDNASGECLLTGRSTDPLGFLNLEVAADPRRARGPICLSISYLQEIAGAAGMANPADLAAAREEISELKLQVVLLEAEAQKNKDEADALYTLVGPKLWAKAQHIRRNAGRTGRKRITAIQAYAKDEITDDELEEALCSTAS